MGVVIVVGEKERKRERERKWFSIDINFIMSTILSVNLLE